MPCSSQTLASVWLEITSHLQNGKMCWMGDSRPHAPCHDKGQCTGTGNCTLFRELAEKAAF